MKKIKKCGLDTETGKNQKNKITVITENNRKTEKISGKSEKIILKIQAFL